MQGWELDELMMSSLEEGYRRSCLKDTNLQGFFLEGREDVEREDVEEQGVHAKSTKLLYTTPTFDSPG